MRHLKSKKQRVEYVDKIECDKCHKKFGEDDFIECQEYFSFRTICGYGSVFGDGAFVSIDLCQDCFKELCGKYVVIK